MTTFQLALLIILGILIFLYIVVRIRDYFRGKIALESRLQILEPDVTYEIVYSINMFGRRKIYQIIPKKEHRTTLTETTFYDGRTAISIQITVSNMVIYSVYLKNVKVLYNSKNDENIEDLENPQDD